MDINTWLILLIGLVLVYMGILVFSVWKAYQLSKLAGQWDRNRTSIFLQAQKNLDKARQLSASLKTKYGDLGEPYAKNRDAAIQILDQVVGKLNKVLGDEKRRRPISQFKYSYGWKTIFISPLWAEIQDRRGWWKETEQLQESLKQVKNSFGEVEKRRTRLANRGLQTKKEFLKQQQEIDRLTQDYCAEAREALPFDEQFAQLSQMQNSIAQILEADLKSDDPAPTAVAAVFPALKQNKSTCTELQNTLAGIQQNRTASRTQIEKTSQLIKHIEAGLQSEESAGRAIPSIKAALETEKIRLQELAQQRKSGDYIAAQNSATQQFSRIQDYQKRLEAIVEARQRLQEVYDRGAQEISETTAWLNLIVPLYVIDETNILLETIQRQQTPLYQAIHSDDPEALETQAFVDPQKLADARVSFDNKKKRYEEKAAHISQEMESLPLQVATVINKLQNQHPDYLAGTHLQNLRQQILALQKRWSEAQEPAQINESRLNQFIEGLQQIEDSITPIQNLCAAAVQVHQTIEDDRKEAKRILEDQDFVDLHQVMQRISLEDRVSFAHQAGEYAHQAEALTLGCEAINSHYASIIDEAVGLQYNMERLWGDYQKKYKERKEQHQRLSEQLQTYQEDLTKYQEHEIFEFQEKIQPQLEEITTWLEMPVPKFLQGLIEYDEQGQSLRQEVERFSKEIGQENQRYQTARKIATDAIEAARNAIAVAEKELGKTPWNAKSYSRRGQTERKSDRLKSSYGCLEDAEKLFEKTIDPKRRYLVEHAIRDLESEVTPKAKEAQEIADEVRRETVENCARIEALIGDLNQILDDGEKLSRQIDDPGMNNEWFHLQRKYDRIRDQIETYDSFRAAERILDDAIRETQFTLSQMRKFENPD